MVLGFIGSGNMGYAMLKGAMSVFGKDIIFTDINENRLMEIKEETGLSYVKTNQDLVDGSDMVVLAVKPQYMESALTGLHIPDEKIVISIAPGMSIAQLKDLIAGQPKIVRAMPNTPALVGEGMSAVSFEPGRFSKEEEASVTSFFNSFGQTVSLGESLMDAVVAVSGSAPAYVYMFIEAMADGAVLHGIPRDMAYQMAAQTLLGSAKMVLETGMHPGALKDMVCSPGGTTIEAVRVLEAKGLRSSVIEGMNRVVEKSQSFKK